MTKQAAYRERVAAGRRVFHIELSTVAVEEMLRGLGYLDAVTEYTKRECDEALARFVNMLAEATGNDARYEFLLRQAIEVFESGDTDQ